ncbi:hypothetical protein P692DRAFT_20822510 [Suillus brevipes Sb2]|nr:hypothetical protein P692DRAFT_20822510 [Suillus brevipes Sb2]
MTDSDYDRWNWDLEFQSIDTAPQHALEPASVDDYLDSCFRPEPQLERNYFGSGYYFPDIQSVPSQPGASAAALESTSVGISQQPPAHSLPSNQPKGATTTYPIVQRSASDICHEPSTSDSIADDMIRGVRPLSRKHKEHTTSKRKTHLQHAPNTEHPGVSLSSPTILQPDLIHDMKAAAVVAMMQAMFKGNLFPSTDDLSRLAETAIGDTIASFSDNGSNNVGTFQHQTE